MSNTFNIVGAISRILDYIEPDLKIEPLDDEQAQDLKELAECVDTVSMWLDNNNHLYDVYIDEESKP